jgi:hypothetical protein
MISKLFCAILTLNLITEAHMLETIVADYIQQNITADDKEFCKILLSNTNKYNNKIGFKLEELKQIYPYATIEELKDALKRLSKPIHFEYGQRRKRVWGIMVILAWVSIDFVNSILHYSFSSLFLELLRASQITQSLEYIPSTSQLELPLQHLRILSKEQYATSNAIGAL